MKIEDMIELLYKPMMAPEIVNALNSLSLAVPAIDQTYLPGEQLDSEEANSGVSFTFQEIGEEINEETSDPNDLILMRLSISKGSVIDLPVNIQWSDSYDVVRDKVGYDATYGDKWMKTMRVWIFERGDEKNIG